MIQGLYGSEADSDSAMGSKTLDQQHTTVQLFPLPLPDQQDRVRLIPPSVPEQKTTVRLIAPWSNEADEDDE